ncbi:hypothetical protein BC351_00215 [Paenibacillus ferrarius]|uniref:HTH crp-type domain-containing protein n=1 Tax=Paenibacillus ferrarius TaxID=1469647 RepID=A0A1V4HS00_9BACL|nr:hypothetical protein [Paenibacillus ferrarius]OPH61701.1 hypothetical protein BC351_00215 [Paenibacillus ferrarius]
MDLEIIEQNDEFIIDAEYHLIDGQFVNTDGEIIQKEILKKSIEKQKLDDFYEAISTMNSLGINSNLRLIRARNGAKYFCIKIKENYTFNKVFRVDMRWLLENVALSDRAQIFLFRFQHYLHFPSNSIVVNSEHPTVEKLGEMMGVKENVTRKTLNELEKQGIIKTQQIANRRIVYFNPFLISSGGIIDVDTYRLFESSIYNSNNKFHITKRNVDGK